MTCNGHTGNDAVTRAGTNHPFNGFNTAKLHNRADSMPCIAEPSVNQIACGTSGFKYNQRQWQRVSGDSGFALCSEVSFSMITTNSSVPSGLTLRHLPAAGSVTRPISIRFSSTPVQYLKYCLCVHPPSAGDGSVEVAAVSEVADGYRLLRLCRQ